jgi:hypothetical protein
MSNTATGGAFIDRAKTQDSIEEKSLILLKQAAT